MNKAKQDSATCVPTPGNFLPTSTGKKRKVQKKSIVHPGRNANARAG